MPTVNVVEVFADVVCPFAHVGLRRFVSRRAELGMDVPLLRVRAWPLELVNDRPFDPDEVEQRVNDLRRQVAPDLFVKFDPAAVPQSSLPALALIAEAYSEGAQVGEMMSLALRTALFEEGRNVGHPAVLADLAAAHGIHAPTERARAAVESDYEDGRRRGVRGSPHFFVGDRDYFCPALTIERVDDELSIAAAPERLDQMLHEAHARVQR